MTNEEIKTAARNEGYKRYTHDGIFSSGSDYEIVDTLADYREHFIKGYIVGYEACMDQEEYQQMKKDAENWNNLKEMMVDSNISLHEKGKSVELLINKL